MLANKKRKKHRFLTFIIIVIILGVVWWINTFMLTTTEVTIEDNEIHDDITIVQLTDLHGSTFGRDNKALIRRVEKAEPDIVVVTGDMYSAGSERGREVAVNLLGKLAEKYPVYAINGEHDNDNHYFEMLENVGVDVLEYESRDINIGSTTLCLYGITNVYYTPTFDLANEFTLDRSKYNILLAHADNFDAFADFGMDLTICGDTHGGQVRLPWAGALINKGIWFPERLGEEEVGYVKGLFEKDGSHLFVSSGLGNYPVPIRFMNMPEVAVIHLK